MTHPRWRILPRSLTRPSLLRLVGYPVAWPTVALFLSCVAGWTWGMYACVTGAYPAVVTVPVQALCVFGIFTPMHDGEGVRGTRVCCGVA